MTTHDSDNHICSILYVEDEPHTREMLGTILRQHYPDVRLFAAGNGKEGFESYKRHKPEIIITDVNMPITGGITMAAKIRSLDPSMEIIALMAYSDKEQLLEAIEAGISHYILKPFKVGQLFRAIDKAFRIVGLKKALERQKDQIMSLNAGLFQKTEALELANKELESFNYTIAHDLRSPLASIGCYLGAFLDKHSVGLDEAGKEYLGFITREIHRVNRLVDVLLKFSLYSQRLLHKEWFSLSDIARAIRDNLLAQAPQRKATFDIADGISGYGDPNLLWIVLDYLLSNAWKYTTRKAHARIEFGSINREEDLVYFVRDNGAGFNQRDAEKLFIPFQRLQDSNDIEGQGIGLATARRIIQRHGGKIWAEGKKGKEAAFYFTL